MAFWGAFVTREQPFTIRYNGGPAPPRRLRISQATIADKTGCCLYKNRSIVCCKVGQKDPIHICSLRINHLECCQLDLEFQESEDVILSVQGPRGVHLAGYYVEDSAPVPNDICLPHTNNGMAEVSSQWVISDKRANEVPGSEETFKCAEAGGHVDRDFAIQHAKEVDIQRIEYVVQKERLEGKLKHSEDAAIGGEIQQHAIVEADCVNEDEAQHRRDTCKVKSVNERAAGECEKLSKNPTSDILTTLGVKTVKADKKHSLVRETVKKLIKGVAVHGTETVEQNGKTEGTKSGNLVEDQVQTRGGKIHEGCYTEECKSKSLKNCLQGEVKKKLKSKKKENAVEELLIPVYPPIDNLKQRETDAGVKANLVREVICSDGNGNANKSAEIMHPALETKGSARRKINCGTSGGELLLKKRKGDSHKELSPGNLLGSNLTQEGHCTEENGRVYQESVNQDRNADARHSLEFLRPIREHSAGVSCGVEGFKSHDTEKVKLKRRKKKRSEEGMMIADCDPIDDQIQSKIDGCCRDCEVDQYSRGNGKCGSSQDVLKIAEPVLDPEVKEMKAAEVKGLDISLGSEENRFANHEDSISYEISMIARQYQDSGEDVLSDRVLPDAEPKKGKKRKKVKAVDAQMEVENERTRKRDKNAHDDVKSPSAALDAGQKENPKKKVKKVGVCTDGEHNRHNNDSSYKEATEKQSIEPSLQNAKTAVANSNSGVLVLALPANLDSSGFGKKHIKREPVV
ncbi:hypothetical protein Ancab_005506 [Ancistrocladus abbreviatus]